jgi:hypothetical protein
MSNDPCDDCGESPCECDHLRKLIEDVSSVLMYLDLLAELWGNEKVFQWCRDGLRAALKRAEKGVTE